MKAARPGRRSAGISIDSCGTKRLPTGTDHQPATAVFIAFDLAVPILNPYCPDCERQQG